MKACVFMGSPRREGNTATLLKPFVASLQARGVETEVMVLADKKIGSCKGCYHCQQVEGAYGCVQQDDMQEAVDLIVASDFIVFATPIYSWYCTAEMKALLDRHYGLNKYYGKAKGSLWEGKAVAILATHGYSREYATSPFETGIIRLCEHSNLRYLGMYSVRDLDGLASFQTEKVEKDAEAFAYKLASFLW